MFSIKCLIFSHKLTPINYSAKKFCIMSDIIICTVSKVKLYPIILDRVYKEQSIRNFHCYNYQNVICLLLIDFHDVLYTSTPVLGSALKSVLTDPTVLALNRVHTKVKKNVFSVLANIVLSNSMLSW